MSEPFIKRVNRIFSSIGGYFKNIERRREVSRIFVEWFADNKWMLLGSIALASLIYFMIHDNSIEIFERRVPVECRNVPVGKSVGVEPSMVLVKFRGSRDERLGLDLNPPTIVVSYPREGISDSERFAVKLRKRDLKMAGGRGFGSAIPVEFEPNTVTLVIDTEDEREFDILPPKIVGTPHHGKATVEFSPRKAKVRGGFAQLNAWEENHWSLRLPDVTVEGRAQSFNEVSEIMPPTGELSLVAIEPKNVTVSVTIVQERRKKELKAVPVRLSLPLGVEIPSGTVFKPGSVDVTIIGQGGAVDEVAIEDVAVYAEADDLPRPFTNSVDLALSVRVPSGVSISMTETVPKTVKLIPRLVAPKPAVTTNMTLSVDEAVNTNALKAIAVEGVKTYFTATNAPSADSKNMEK